MSSKGTLLSEPLALGDLFNPATFVNALRQQSARMLKTAIDRVKMVSSWSKDSKSLSKQCPLTCTVTSLLLQGAAFNGTSLLEPAPEASEISPAPQVHFGFTSYEKTGDKDQDEDKDENGVEVPVYLNPSREEYLMDFVMPMSSKGDRNSSSSNNNKNKWILSGVALFLSEDE